MTNYLFEVSEVKRGGFIAWDVKELSHGNPIAFPVNHQSPYKAGSYPDIEDYLQNTYSITCDLNYDSSKGDSFDQAQQKWTFKRPGYTVEVQDIPRTIERLTVYRSTP